MMPYFAIDVDYTQIFCGPVESRSKENVYGILWCSELKEKCRIFIAFEERNKHQKFNEYFRKLLKFFEIGK